MPATQEIRQRMIWSSVYADHPSQDWLTRTFLLAGSFSVRLSFSLHPRHLRIWDICASALDFGAKFSIYDMSSLSAGYKFTAGLFLQCTTMKPTKDLKCYRVAFQWNFIYTHYIYVYIILYIHIHTWQTMAQMIFAFTYHTWTNLVINIYIVYIFFLQTEPVWKSRPEREEALADLNQWLILAETSLNMEFLMFIQIPEYHWGSSCEKMGLTNGWSGTPSRSQALGRTVLLQEMYVYIYFFFLWPPLRSLRRVTECRAHGEKRASWCIPQSRVWSSWRILCLKLQLLSNAQHMNRLNSETNRQNALCMRRILQSARL